MKKLLALFLILCATVVWANTPKYVFLFIGDGMSVPQRMTAEEFSRKVGAGTLAMNHMPFQAMTRTASSNSLVTDSAAAATAIACGVKTYNGAIGVDSKGEKVSSCAYAAKNAGKKVGIISTVTITHATPAGFYASRKNRGETYGIALDLARSGFDFFAGGGLDNKYKDAKHPEFKKCGNAYDYAEKNGYKIVKTRDEFLQLKKGCGKILTRFKDSALGFSIDLDENDRQKYPSLAELVGKAAEVLDGEDGFFIMAEGGSIDWAGHANDAASNLRDVLALDDAVKVALKFYEKHPEDTLIVVTGDHETGGMSMGFNGTGYALYTENLRGQKMSVGTFDRKAQEIMRKNPAVDFAEIKKLISDAFGLGFSGDENKGALSLSEKEEDEIKKAFAHDISFTKSKVEENSKYDGEKRYLLGGVCRRIISNRSGIGWSSGAHTAMPVLTTAMGVGAEKFSGFIENTDISKIIKSFYK